MLPACPCKVCPLKYGDEMGAALEVTLALPGGSHITHGPAVMSPGLGPIATRLH